MDIYGYCRYGQRSTFCQKYFSMVEFALSLGKSTKIYTFLGVKNTLVQLLSPNLKNVSFNSILTVQCNLTPHLI